MDAPRPTANVRLEELLGVPFLTNDPRNRSGNNERTLFGHQSPETTADAGNGDRRQHLRLRLSLRLQLPLPQPVECPLDLQEGDDMGYMAPTTRAWQRFNHPLCGSKVKCHDMSPAARQRRLAQNNLPRFLFRGYCQRSGGGNPYLNQWDKFIPHYFLTAAESTETCVPRWTMADFPRRDEVIQAHLTGDASDAELRQTPFSSWSQSPQRGPDDGSARVAVLDTTRLRPWNEVYNVAEMRYQGYHSLPLRYGCWEYFVYGPIEGASIHTFPRQSFTDLWRPDISLGSLDTTTPYPVFQNGRPLSRESVRHARDLAGLFVKKHGWAGERSTVVLYVSILLLATWRHSHMNPPAQGQLAQTSWDPRDVMLIAHEFWTEITEHREVKLAGDDPQRVSMGYKWFFDALLLMNSIDTGDIHRFGPDPDEVV
ncbi:uncharacterized protein PG998_007034 [Apiospora kogelbergensis]|uniref:uncharacterized protein n=1 Tax=Apiospora kogelbergensis TaxID=1337665 RepID=UPI003131BA47